MFCQKCGESLQENAKFCPKCGMPTSTPVNITDEPLTSESESSNAQDNKIWNPNAAANWSLIFSPAFGSYIHAINWRILGEKDKEKSAMGWFYFSLVILIIYILMGIFMTDEKAANGLTFLYLLIWYFSVGKSQAKYVKEKFGKDYPRRGWGKPLLIGVMGVIGYVFLAAAIAFTLGMMMA